ncbi:MAG: DNA-binding protein [Methylotenera sp.]|nr:MAG: DNA-binding protein [Methylotenera sp.]
MSLANLLKINKLQLHNPSKDDVQRLLAAAKRNLADAHIHELSPENRFDAAYKCIMQSAMAALSVNGYRTSTSQPGHHQTAIQTLPLTIGLEQSTVIVLDALRKQRNVSDYEGDPVSDQVVIECIKQAGILYQNISDWISKNRPDFV